MTNEIIEEKKMVDEVINKIKQTILGDDEYNCQCWLDTEIECVDELSERGVEFGRNQETLVYFRKCYKENMISSYDEGMCPECDLICIE